MQMAKEVLGWLSAPSSSEEAKRIWEELGITNTKIYEALVTLNGIASSHPKNFSSAVAKASLLPVAGLPADDSETVGVFSALTELKTLFKKARSLLKEMGRGAGKSSVLAQY